MQFFHQIFIVKNVNDSGKAFYEKDKVYPNEEDIDYVSENSYVHNMFDKVEKIYHVGK